MHFLEVHNPLLYVVLQIILKTMVGKQTVQWGTVSHVFDRKRQKKRILSKTKLEEELYSDLTGKRLAFWKTGC